MSWGRRTGSEESTEVGGAGGASGAPPASFSTPHGRSWVWPRRARRGWRGRSAAAAAGGDGGGGARRPPPEGIIGQAGLRVGMTPARAPSCSSAVLDHHWSQPSYLLRSCSALARRSCSMSFSKIGRSCCGSASALLLERTEGQVVSARNVPSFGRESPSFGREIPSFGTESPRRPAVSDDAQVEHADGREGRARMRRRAQPRDARQRAPAATPRRGRAGRSGNTPLRRR